MRLPSDDKAPQHGNAVFESTRSDEPESVILIASSAFVQNRRSFALSS